MDQSARVRRRWHGFEAILCETGGDYSDALDGWSVSAPALKLVVNLSPALVEKVARAMGLDPAQTHVAPRLNPHDERIEHLCRAIAIELQSEEPADPIYTGSLGTALASHLLRTYASGATRPKNGLPKGRLRNVLDHIQQYLSRDLSVTELAAVANSSPSHFKVLFKQSTGMPVHQYVIKARVERALDLLVSTELPLSEIALQCGFASQSHLGVCFRLRYGKTPAEFRRDFQ